MKISRKWLSQYMDISDLSMEDIATKVTAAGLEVEGLYKLSQGTNLVIGYVEECVEHPDSDHLHCTKVNIGDETIDIVCGAPNIAAGQKVIVALPGAKLPGGEIKSGVIRGKESNGMICSLLELGVEPHLLDEKQKSGIEVLSEEAPVGYTDPLEYLGLKDEVLDISLTPNRTDCLSAFNMALEAGAVLEKEVTLPDYNGVANCGNETNLKIESKTKKCSAFLGKIIGSVTIKESPRWMKELLMASGMNSINNIVDISNIVMLETGQPIHFYEKETIKDQSIIVKDGLDQDYIALDGETYHLKPEDIVITNQGMPIGIAGIMGGNDSKINNQTQGLIIECARFDHVAIRNTSRRLNLSTESSLRFQKGIEPLAIQKAMDRAVELLIQYADADNIEETVEYGDLTYKPVVIEGTLDQINNRLGTNYRKEEVQSVFERLHFAPRFTNEKFTVTIPSYRTDIEGIADLSEEVIRIMGYDNLPSTLPSMEMTEGKLNSKQRFIRQVREFLCEQGLQDCVTYTLVSENKKDNAILSVGETIELASPMSEERRYIRTSVLPSLLDVVSYNQARNIKDVNVFEISDVASNEAVRSHLAFALTGALRETRWNNYSLVADFYTAKGLIETILDNAGIAEKRLSYRQNKMDVEHFHPYQSAELWIGKDLIGVFGTIHPRYAKELELKDVIIGEFNFEKIIEVKKSKIKFAPISKYPSVQRDVAFVIERNLPVQNVKDVILKNGKIGKENVIRTVDIFDVYEGEHVQSDEKSVAIKIIFQSDHHTLTDKEINELFDKILNCIKKECNAQLRV